MQELLLQQQHQQQFNKPRQLLRVELNEDIQNNPLTLPEEDQPFVNIHQEYFLKQTLASATILVLHWWLFYFWPINDGVSTNQLL